MIDTLTLTGAGPTRVTVRGVQGSLFDDPEIVLDHESPAILRRRVVFCLECNKPGCKIHKDTSNPMNGCTQLF